jgi:hypothetical protein
MYMEEMAIVTKLVCSSRGTMTIHHQFDSTSISNACAQPSECSERSEWSESSVGGTWVLRILTLLTFGTGRLIEISR